MNSAGGEFRVHTRKQKCSKCLLIAADAALATLQSVWKFQCRLFKEAVTNLDRALGFEVTRSTRRGNT